MFARVTSPGIFIHRLIKKDGSGWTFVPCPPIGWAVSSSMGLLCSLFSWGRYTGRCARAVGCLVFKFGSTFDLWNGLKRLVLHLSFSVVLQ